MPLRILVIEDDLTAAKHLARAFEREGHAVQAAASAAEGLRAAREDDPQIVLLDLNLPDRPGLEVLAELKRLCPACEVVVNTGVSDVEMAVRAMRAGAFDYIVKPLNLPAILLTIERVAAARSLKQENRFLREQYESRFSLDHVGIHGPILAAVYEEASRFAPRELPVLIQGESGTGKELVARHLHARTASGGKHAGPFIPINCAALPATLVESELFGYASGAFTGAERGGRKGQFAAADGGSVFLDEVGELPLEMQAKLLRFLESRRFFPVGGTREMSVDVKVICATNRVLAEEVAAGRFRKDLFFRINVGFVSIPPLRERRKEILPLARQFLEEFAAAYNRRRLAIDPAAAALLENAAWPGNVRELKNVCERVVLVEEGPALTAAWLRRLGLDAETPAEAVPAAPPPTATDGVTLPPDGFDLEAHVDAVVRAAFLRSGKNQSRTARYLGVTREILRHRLKKIGLLSPRDAAKSGDAETDG